MLKMSIAAATAAFVVTGAAPAMAQQTVPTFTTANVIEALNAVGITDGVARKSQNSDGSSTDYVGFTYGGLKHIAALEVCNTGAPGCLGLNLLTIWDGAGGVVDRNRVNDFNASFNFGKGFTVQSALVFQRYAISDGGVTKKYIQANIGNFLAVGERFTQFVGGSGGSTVSAAPGEGVATKAVLSPDEEAAVAAWAKAYPNRWNAPVAKGDMSADHLR